jgi:hypothetical protein
VPELLVHHGGRDVIKLLEQAIDEARKGDLTGLVIAGFGPDGQGWTYAYSEAEQMPFSRLISTVSVAQHELIAKGVVGELPPEGDAA